MYTRDLSANVPLYGQEQCCWCGAASGQMIRNGYPNAADRLFYTQLDVWNTIQTFNSASPADAGWCTDPFGLRDCLQSLANPAGVHWVVFSGASRDWVLFQMLYWMNTREYPSAVLINQGEHWVVIVGFTTDVEPLAGTSPVLQSIIIHDPEPHNVGTDTLMTGAQWFSGPWNGAIRFAGTWLGQYAAVVEPPTERGSVKAEIVDRIGERLLSPEEALKYARRWIAELRLAENPRYRLLGRRDVEALEPALVREELLDAEGKEVAHYYIVPFGFRHDLRECGARAVRVAVLVNAYTGNFEEVTAFGRPMRFLSRGEALDVVAGAMHVDRKKIEQAQAALMFVHSDITHVRTMPFWRVLVADRVVYVDQLGKLYGKLLPSLAGD